MPTLGVSSEWLETLEDEIAHMVTARDHLDKVRNLGDLLRRRDLISQAYYADLRDSLDYIAAALLTGKHNTARLRNGGCRE